MSADDIKKGFLTVEDLKAVWTGAVDEDYADAFLNSPDEEGTAPYFQCFEQLSRVSKAIDVTTQAMFILPHSMQTNPSAQGEAYAEVPLSFSRTLMLERELVLRAGMIIEETEIDWGRDAGVEVLTGRRYVLTETVMFAPGDPGPVVATARAEKPGYGYNNPRIGTIKTIIQHGASYTNDRASARYEEVTLTEALTPRNKQFITADNEAEAFIPQHVGQYAKLVTSTLHAGEIHLIEAYHPPVAPTHGGEVEIAITVLVRINTLTGSFLPNEQVRFRDGSATSVIGRHVATRLFGSKRFTMFTIDSTALGAGFPLTLEGIESGASATGIVAIDLVHVGEQFAESGTIEWKILDWKADFGLSVENTAHPSGGRIAMLDELGIERKVQRSPSESDAAYALRVHEVADTIAPNAMKRAMNKILLPINKRGYLREIGNKDTDFLGFFFDGSSDDAKDSACAFDFDFDVQPIDRFKLVMNYTEMRAFFMIGVPVLPATGDFGFFFDGDSGDAVPGNPGALDLAAFDGYAPLMSDTYRRLWQSIDAIRGGAVGFDLYQETLLSTTA